MALSVLLQRPFSPFLFCRQMAAQTVFPRLFSANSSMYDVRAAGAWRAGVPASTGGVWHTVQAIMAPFMPQGMSHYAAYAVT